ncbi:MAG: AsmA family protein [Hyphomicrobiaceae bacterium]
MHAAPPPRRELPPERRSGLGRVALYILGGLVTLAVAAAALLLVYPPTDLVRGRLAAEVERQTGRKLAIRDAGITLASGLGVRLSGVSLSAPPAMGGRPLLTAERIDVSLSLLPLVLREVKLEQLTLVRPVLELRVDGSGRRSWDFAAERALGAPRYAQASGRATDAGLPAELKEFVRNASPPGQGRAAAGLGLEGLSLADVRIEGGRIRYEDGRAGVTHDVRGIDATLSLPAVGGPLSVKGNVTFAAERIAVDARIDQLRDLLAERIVPARIKLDGSSLAASFDGRLAAGAQPAGEGRLILKSAAPAAVARAMELPISGLEGLGPVAFEGQIKVAPLSVSIASSTFSSAAMAGTGAAAIELAAERPSLTANLRLASLDVERLSGIALVARPSAATAAGRFAAPAAVATPPAAGPATAPPGSIGDLIERETAPPATSPATRVHGFRQRAGNQWDVDAIDTGLLKTFDADIRATVTMLKLPRLELQGVQAGAELKSGVLRASLTDAQVAGGHIRGLVSLDSRQAALTVGANLSGDSVAMKPLLDAAGIDLLDGRGRAVVAVSAQGTSERELISTLGGRADLKISDGHLHGWDAQAIVDGLVRGQMPPAHRQGGTRTPFRELSATFQIAQGVARTKDIRLDGNALSASGTGTVNIVDRNVDFTLKPRVAAGGLEVPVRIAGSWEDPSVVADVAGALKSPQAQEAVRQLKDGNVEGALRSVLGNGPKADEKIGKAKELLRGFLGR